MQKSLHLNQFDLVGSSSAKCNRVGVAQGDEMWAVNQHMILMMKMIMSTMKMLMHVD
jgi:hypothetical protein